jgi:hypothetical protein
MTARASGTFADAAAQRGQDFVAEGDRHRNGLTRTQCSTRRLIRASANQPLADKIERRGIGEEEGRNLNIRSRPALLIARCFRCAEEEQSADQL